MSDPVPDRSAATHVVLYDSDCGFCKWALDKILAWDRRRHLRPVAIQSDEGQTLLAEVPEAKRLDSWHLVSPTGERRSAGDAVAPLLRLLPAGRLPAAGFARFPRLTDRGYRWVAEHRSELSKWVPSSAKQRVSQRIQQREQEHETC